MGSKGLHVLPERWLCSHRGPSLTKELARDVGATGSGPGRWNDEPGEKASGCTRCHAFQAWRSGDKHQPAWLRLPAVLSSAGKACPLSGSVPLWAVTVILGNVASCGDPCGGFRRGNRVELACLLFTTFQGQPPGTFLWPSS